MVPSLNLCDLIFPLSASLHCDVIATFSDQQAVDIRTYQQEIEHVNVETLKIKSSLNRN